MTLTMRFPNAYVGTPWQEFGRTAEGCDCWGLACIVYREELHISLPDYLGAYTSAEERGEIAQLIDGAKASPLWVPVEGKALAFDIAVFRRGRFSSHVGIVVRHGTSNAVQMWTPAQIMDRTNGWWLEPRKGMTVASGAAAALTDLFGQSDFSNYSASGRPTVSADGNYLTFAAKTLTHGGAAAPVAAAPHFIIQMLTYKASATAFDSKAYYFGFTQIRGVSAGTLFDTSAGSWTAKAGAVAMINGAAASLTVTPLPMTQAILDVSVPAGIDTSGNWVLGAATSNYNFPGDWWGSVALGSVPTADIRARLQAYFAHAYGTAAKLPATHTYKLASSMRIQ